MNGDLGDINAAIRANLTDAERLIQDKLRAHISAKMDSMEISRPEHRLYYETENLIPRRIRCTCGEWEMPVDQQGGFDFSALDLILAHNEEATFPDIDDAVERTT